MSLHSIGNTLSLQQIMQLLHQQSLGAADPEAAASGEARTPDPAGQNLPGETSAPEELAAPGAQLAPAKPTLDTATIKTLLEIQEAETRAADTPDLAGLDAAQLQSILAAMTGSAASGNAIATVTEAIMGLLDGAGLEESADAAVNAVEA